MPQPQADPFDMARTKAILAGTWKPEQSPFSPDVMARTKAILAPRLDLPIPQPLRNTAGWNLGKELADEATYGALSEPSVPAAQPDKQFARKEALAQALQNYQSKKAWETANPGLAAFAHVAGRSAVPTALSAVGDIAVAGAGLPALAGATSEGAPWLLRAGAQTVPGAWQGALTAAVDPELRNSPGGIGEGALLGAAFGPISYALASPLRSGITAEDAQLARRYIDQGMPLSLAQIPGAPGAVSTASMLGRFTSKLFRMSNPDDIRAVTSKVAEGMGMSGDTLTSGQVAARRQALGQNMDQVALRSKDITDSNSQLRQNLATLWNRAKQPVNLGTSAQAPDATRTVPLAQLRNHMSTVLALLNNGGISGGNYRALTRSDSELMQDIDADGAASPWLRQLRSALDNAYDTANPAEAAQMRLMRNQYRIAIAAPKFIDDATQQVNPRAMLSKLTASGAFGDAGALTSAGQAAGNNVDLGAVALGANRFVRPQPVHVNPALAIGAAGAGMTGAYALQEMGLPETFAHTLANNPVFTAGATGLGALYGAAGMAMNNPGYRNLLLLGASKSFPPLPNPLIPMGVEARMQSGPRQFSAAPYADTIVAAGKQYGQDPGLLARQLRQESGFNPYAVSATGAAGLGQFEPATAKQYGVDVNDPTSSIMGTARYMRDLQARFGNEGLALAAYNWGPGNVSKWLRNGADPAKMPSETRNYVSSIAQMPITSFLGGASSAPGFPVQDNKPLVGATPTPVWQDPGAQ